MDGKAELLILRLRSEAEELYSSKECKEKVIQDVVKASLLQNLKENKISSSEYEEALDILRRYETNLS